MSKKYEILKDDYRFIGDAKIYRIRLLVNGVVPNAKKGDLGGFVQNEENLDQNGSCWLYDNSIAMERARVYENAKLYDDAIIFENARASGNARMKDYSRVFQYAHITEECSIEGHSSVKHDSIVKGDTLLLHNSAVSGSACVESCRLFDNSRISSRSYVYDCVLRDNALIIGTPDSDVIEYAEFGKDAFIMSRDDYIYIRNLGQENKPCSFYRTKNGINVKIDFFNGDIELFRNLVKDKYGSCGILNKTGVEYFIAAGLAELKNALTKT